MLIHAINPVRMNSSMFLMLKFLVFTDTIIKKKSPLLTHAQYATSSSYALLTFQLVTAARLANDQVNPYNGGTDEVRWPRGAHHRSRRR